MATADQTDQEMERPAEQAEEAASTVEDGPPAATVAGPAAAEEILVIRLGALGDFVQSLGPMAAIRRRHPEARITLLTTAPFVSLARASGWFDRVWGDGRPAWWRLADRLGLRNRLHNGRFDRVYDLQTSRRTAGYWRMMRRPAWSGHVPGCSHPHVDPRRNGMHTIDRQRAQLVVAGIVDVPPADLSWVDAPVGHFGLSERYVLLVPGGSAHRPGKRWPAQKYGALARALANDAVTPVVIGGRDEQPVAAAILALCPRAVDLTGRTSFEELVVLGRGAVGAVGNDTGPMHLIATAGCPSLVLFSRESDPALCAPRPGALGGRVAVLRRQPLSALSVDEVRTALPFALTD